MDAAGITFVSADVATFADAVVVEMRVGRTVETELAIVDLTILLTIVVAAAVVVAVALEAAVAETAAAGAVGEDDQNHIAVDETLAEHVPGTDMIMTIVAFGRIVIFCVFVLLNDVQRGSPWNVAYIRVW